MSEKKRLTVVNGLELEHFVVRFRHSNRRDSMIREIIEDFLWKGAIVVAAQPTFFARTLGNGVGDSHYLGFESEWIITAADSAELPDEFEIIDNPDNCSGQFIGSVKRLSPSTSLEMEREGCEK